MCHSETIFEKYNRAICRDQLRRRLEVLCADGTELFGVVDHALPGLENAAAAATIKAASKSNYAGSILIDVVVERVMAFLEIEKRMEANAPQQ
jgi:hypothetical protein